MQVIDTRDGSIHDVFSTHVKKITSCGNPDLLDLTKYGFEEYVPPEPPAPSYEFLRRMEYPPIEDYLDGIVKNDQQQIQTYINACLVVKAKYPKS